MSLQTDSRSILLKFNPLSRDEVYALQTDQWLNDNVLQFYIEYDTRGAEEQRIPTILTLLYWFDHLMSRAGPCYFDNVVVVFLMRMIR